MGLYVYVIVLLNIIVRRIDEISIVQIKTMYLLLSVGVLTNKENIVALTEDGEVACRAIASMMLIFSLVTGTTPGDLTAPANTTL